MGKGDKRSKRGKIFRGTFGKSRPKHKKIVKGAPEQQEPDPMKENQEKEV